MARRKLRNYVFTANRKEHIGDANLPDWDDEAKAFAALFGPVKVLSFQLETAPTTGRLHWQGYVEFPNPRSKAGCQKIWRGIHLEARNGTKKQAIDYTRKAETRTAGPWLFPEGTSYEEVVKDNKGRRTDLEDAVQILLDGGTPRDVARTHLGTWVRYSRGITAAASLLGERKQRDPLKVLLLSGPTGVGKSHWIYTAPGVGDYYRKAPGKWFDGYHGQETIVFDDYDWSTQKVTDALNWLDRWKCVLEIKGGMTEARWSQVVIITNTAPRTWWPWVDPEHLEAFNRRVTHEVVLQTRGDPQWKKGNADEWNVFFNGEQ